MEDGKKYIVMINGEKSATAEVACTPLTGNTVHLKATCDFRDRTDKGTFYYSLDGTTWSQISNVLQMEYTLPHFMGYRFGLFNWATKEKGGWVEWDVVSY